ncbi:MAG TPA: energy transducer TonB [Patescibacteria group bacterium]|nr:energy transducer TonB [Patescibacteria group bacterium]
MKRNSFRRAMTISIGLHCLLLPAVALMSAAFWQPAPETILELDLVSEPLAAVSQLQSPASMAVKPAQPQVRTPMAAPASTAATTLSEPVAAPATVAETSAEQTSWQPAAITAPAGGSAENINGAGGGPSAGTGGEGGKAKTGIVSPPRLLDKTEPSYPAEARNQGIEGTVGVRIDIGENGRPNDCQVVRSSGHASLDNAALTAVRQWRFAPARDQDSGSSVRCYSTVTVVFNLK